VTIIIQPSIERTATALACVRASLALGSEKAACGWSMSISVSAMVGKVVGKDLSRWRGEF
jgi:hypothetical protein